LAQGVGEAAVPRGKVLRAQIERTRIAAFTGHPTTTAAAFVEQVYGLPGIVKCTGCGQARDSGTDDGDWSLAHDYLECCVISRTNDWLRHDFMTSVR
jgi:hypothetical protein